MIGNDRIGNERKGKERKGKERKGKERKGKERKGKDDGLTLHNEANESVDLAGCRSVKA